MKQRAHDTAFEEMSMTATVLPKRLFDTQEISVIESCNVDVNIKYSTVTHVWGTDNYSVRIRGINWKIPWNDITVNKVAEMLRKLCIRYVWIDILCIDQESNKDKENEIPKMALYYENADACLLIDKHNLENIRLLYDAAKSDLNGFDVKKDHLMMLQVFSTEYFSRWMSRIWTYQEVALSNKVLAPLLINSTWNTVDISQYSTVNGFRREYTMKYDSNVKRMNNKNREQIWKSIKAYEDILEIKAENTNVTLGKAIKLTYGREASKDHDYVYGLLGIVKGGSKVPIVYEKEKPIDSFKRVCVTLGNNIGDWSVIYAASTSMYPCLVSNKLEALLPDAYKCTTKDEMYATHFDNDKLYVKTYVSEVIKEAYTFRVRELVAGDTSSAIYISVLTNGRLAEVISSISVFTNDDDRLVEFIAKRSKIWFSYRNLYEQALRIDTKVKEKKPLPDLSDTEINKILEIDGLDFSIVGAALSEISGFLSFTYEGNKNWIVNTGNEDWHIITSAHDPMERETYIVGRNKGVNTRIVVRKNPCDSYEKIGVAFGTLTRVNMKEISIRWFHTQFPPQKIN